MAWTKESKTNPIIDDALGALTTWNGTEFIWSEITTAYCLRLWAKETKSASGWTKEA